jgi:hypothetical protein
MNSLVQTWDDGSSTTVGRCTDLPGRASVSASVPPSSRFTANPPLPPPRTGRIFRAEMFVQDVSCSCRNHLKPILFWWLVRNLKGEKCSKSAVVLPKMTRVLTSSFGSEEHSVKFDVCNFLIKLLQWRGKVLLFSLNWGQKNLGSSYPESSFWNPCIASTYVCFVNMKHVCYIQ